MLAAEAGRLAVAVRSSSPRASSMRAPREEAEEALATAVGVEGPSEVGDGDVPQWPDEAAEIVFLSEQGGSADPAPIATSRIPSSEVPLEPAEDANAPLPLLQSLVDRIPADARDVLEDLFRARFVSVKRVQTSALK